MKQFHCIAVLLLSAIGAQCQRDGTSSDTPVSEIDWHEWITDDEDVDTGVGHEELSWKNSPAWGLLSNSSAVAPRPPIFLLAGIASTRLVNWRDKECRGSNIKARDVVWVNIGKLVETKTIDPTCWVECMKVGPRGSDPVGENGERGCVLRPDEGLDAVSAMAPGLLTSGISQVRCLCCHCHSGYKYVSISITICRGVDRTIAWTRCHSAPPRQAL